MEPRLTENLMVAFVLITLYSAGSAVTYEDWNFCGTWQHGSGPLKLNLNLSTGCDRIVISADRNSMSIDGRITSVCSQVKELPLSENVSKLESHFCLYWEPLQDHLRLQFRGKYISLCPPDRLPDHTCCSHLSNGFKAPEAPFGIINGGVMGDVISRKIHTDYKFNGTPIACKLSQAELNQGSQNDIKPAKVDTTEDTSKGNTTEVQMEKVVKDGGRTVEVEMGDRFRGINITSNTKGISAEITTTVQIPSALKNATQSTNKVVCTFHEDKSMFQEGELLNVVEITVGNDTIENLSEPIKIGFHHNLIPKKHSRKCVSWDTKKDESVNWVMDGCETRENGTNYTECLCNHLTYFAVLVQLRPGLPVRHLLALTAISSLGSAVSVVSCIALIIFLCRKCKRSKEQSMPIHLGLAGSLLLLYLLFFLTGILANVVRNSGGPNDVCTWVGAGLHYALLCSLSWMGIETFHTFWLVFMVFSPSPKPYVWNIFGFALPALLVGILAAVGDIYGLREVPGDDESGPYLMCWMTLGPKAILAHYFTNMTILVILVVSGLVMLFLVYRQIRSRDEWRQNRVAFLSIWGLSCLFGTAWVLTFLDFDPISDFVLFLFCIINSFQGFLLMLRFFMLDWIRKQAGGSASGSTSSGSTRQHMLQAQEKS
ncbi:adhesion G-protein coupled receptor G5-like [Xyrichtys novacula]|uniref:Adhesion G-protein coupled receptor G5-like n=1 Tax=Xyrichtys novacula TaxID=13765 RepID=A0AAV1EII7_XYRNO|nr:adhesion G-protein coupled receptor G5-like [Xyrichtys novacula]